MSKPWNKYVNFFFVYCVIGWIYEIIWEFAVGHGFVNRGFLFGPYLPIYGVGVLILYFLLHNIMKKDIRSGNIKVTPIVIFILIMIIVSVIEYIGSLILEKVFNERLWDYSYDLINLNGRISLRNSACLSTGAMFMLYLIWPLLEKIHKKINDNISKIIAITIICIMSVDLIFTLMKYIPKN